MPRAAFATLHYFAHGYGSGPGAIAGVKGSFRAPPREEELVSSITAMTLASSNPIILVDGMLTRHRFINEVHELIEQLRIPVFVTPIGKVLVNEQSDCFGRFYAGVMS